MKILFVCGGGASSSFIAQNVRKAGKDIDMDVNVEAIGETELEDYVAEKDVILIGPHLKYLEHDLAAVINEYHIPYAFISQADYAKMNGESILKQALKLMKS